MKNKIKPKINIMQNVSFLDLVQIRVFQTTPENIQVTFECIEKNKNVVFDEKALKEMNYKINEKVIGMNAKDPKVKEYINEFVAKLAEALYKNGLVEIVEATEAKTDPYGDLRNQFDRK